VYFSIRQASDEMKKWKQASDEMKKWKQASDEIKKGASSFSSFHRSLFFSFRPTEWSGDIPYHLKHEIHYLEIATSD
jgi:hypothetical protein